MTITANLTCDGTYKYAYDSENHMVEVRKFSDNSLVATYSYNHDGLRKSKTVYTGTNLVTTNFYWDVFGRLVGSEISSFVYDQIEHDEMVSENIGKCVLQIILGR